MLSMTEYFENKDVLTQNAIEHFKMLEKKLYPCRYLGITASNFKLISILKKEASMKIENFFKKQPEEQY